MFDGIRPTAAAGWWLLAAALPFRSVAGETGGWLEFIPRTAGPVREGGFSDLTRDPRDTTGRTFLSISDRGPNRPDGKTVFFPAPAYHQKISRFHLEPDGALRLVAVDSIRTPSGGWTTGLPSPAFPVGEQAVGRDGEGRERPIAPDNGGYDFEGLWAQGDTALWASEEYGPRVLRLHRDAAGSARITGEWSPGRGLPEVFARREPNKGLEALCGLPDGRLVAIFQGALANAATGDPSDVAERSLARRLVVLDPATGSTRQLVAEMDLPDKPKHRTKIGACTALDQDRILVLEHRKARKGRTEVDLVVWNLAQATDIGQPLDTSGRGRRVGGRTLEEIATVPGTLGRAGIVPVARTAVVRDLTRDAPSGEALTKPEGLALLPGPRSEALVVFDNDFAIQGSSVSSWFLRVGLPALRP